MPILNLEELAEHALSNTDLAVGAVVKLDNHEGLRRDVQLDLRSAAGAVLLVLGCLAKSNDSRAGACIYGHVLRYTDLLIACQGMELVVIESPLAGDFARNIRYAKLCGLDCIRRGEAPYASHLLMTQFLDDALPEERKVGMEAGFAWGVKGAKRVVYDDLGISGGMKAGIAKGQEIGQVIEYRKLPADLMALLDKGPPTKTEGI